jgi:hypothetical protein
VDDGVAGVGPEVWPVKGWNHEAHEDDLDHKGHEEHEEDETASRHENKTKDYRLHCDERGRYIARTDGDVEWLNRRPRKVDYGMRQFYPTVDTILWGRKTYEWLLNYYAKRGKTKGLFDTKVANYVFSRRPPKRVASGVEFVSDR